MKQQTFERIGIIKNYEGERSEQLLTKLEQFVHGDNRKLSSLKKTRVKTILDKRFTKMIQITALRGLQMSQKRSNSSCWILFFPLFPIINRICCIIGMYKKNSACRHNYDQFDYVSVTLHFTEMKNNESAFYTSTTRLSPTFT